MSSYRQALKTARTEYIRKLIDNHQNNPRFLFSTVARLTINGKAQHMYPHLVHMHFECYRVYNA